MNIKIEDRRFVPDYGDETNLETIVDWNREDEALFYYIINLMELEVGNSWQYGPHSPKFTRTK